MDKYRLVERKNEIMDFVKKAPALGIGVIWQTTPNMRIIHHINKVELDPVKELMHFETTMPFELVKGHPVYIKIEYRNLVFKLKEEDYKVDGTRLSCSCPENARAVDLRDQERVYIPEKVAFLLTLEGIDGENKKHFEVRVINFSEKGLGVLTSEKNQDFFIKNSAFRIVEINGNPVTDEAVLTVKHISVKFGKNKQVMHLKAGMSLNQPLGERFYEAMRIKLKRA